jgi:hypothetical protein
MNRVIQDIAWWETYIITYLYKYPNFAGITTSPGLWRAVNVIQRKETRNAYWRNLLENIYMEDQMVMEE